VASPKIGIHINFIIQIVFYHNSSERSSLFGHRINFITIWCPGKKQFRLIELDNHGHGCTLMKIGNLNGETFEKRPFLPNSCLRRGFGRQVGVIT